MQGPPFAGVVEGERFGPVGFTVSPAANQRYWASAGARHPLLAAGALYPPIAANLTILAFQTIAPVPLLHARQRLRAHRSGPAGVELTVTGAVSERYERRDREYVVVIAEITLFDGDPLWTSVATFCEPGA
ncbi:MAG: MaoC family dehydratase [Actinobacteria bacterium]|nr:MaoC family dehydratase [Actinomycetota bacterium]